MKSDFLAKILTGWGIFWGVLGMGLYFIGLLGWFYRPVVLAFGLFCLLTVSLILWKKKVSASTKTFYKNFWQILKKDWIVGLILAGFVVFAAFNFIINLAPEVGFDALWYHLTLPKIYLMTHNVSYIPGGLLYYSVMPRLGEMIYGFGLSLDATGYVSKMIHYFFGLSWFGGTYLLARHFLSRRGALAAAVAGYGTYLTTWLSQTAYIDLIVAFYAVMALWGLFRYLKEKKILFLYLAAVFTGLVLSSKIYGLFLFAVILGVLIFKSSWRIWCRYLAISIIIVLPFYLQAYLATGNPFYPVFSVKDSALEMYTNGYSNLKDWYLNLWWKELPGLLWQMIVYRLTPIFGLAALFLLSKNFKKMVIPIFLFLGFFILWSLNPVQEPRYFISIVPLLSVISFYTIENINWKFFKFMAIILFLVGLVYNFSFGITKFKETWQMVFGQNPKENYLRARLEAPRNFYDFTGNFGREIQDKKVLTVNIHNLFYINFRFWDWSFVENKYSLKNGTQNFAENLKQDGYDYVLIDHLSVAEWPGLTKEDSDKYFEEVLKENDFTLYKIN